MRRTKPTAKPQPTTKAAWVLVQLETMQAVEVRSVKLRPEEEELLNTVGIPIYYDTESATNARHSYNYGNLTLQEAQSFADIEVEKLSNPNAPGTFIEMISCDRSSDLKDLKLFHPTVKPGLVEVTPEQFELATENRAIQTIKIDSGKEFYTLIRSHKILFGQRVIHADHSHTNYLHPRFIKAVETEGDQS